jgi:hypothetical protein
MSSSAKTSIAIFVVLVLVVATIYWIWVRPRLDSPLEQLVEAPTPTPAPEPTPSLAERLSERLKGTTLKTSDAVVRELVAELSSNPQLVKWLANEDLIRRFVAAVDNIAAGVSPTSQLDFMRPKGSFEVVEKDDILIVDPKSYDRYDLATRVFVSLDIEGTAALYRELEPLIDDAYAEISPPGSRFSDRLAAAFDELLAVVPPSEEAELQPKVLTYVYVDESIEGLDPVQRHFLRMGPENVLLIKAKLRDLKAAIQ